MLQNLSLKLFSFILAVVFWVLVVSLENTFVKFSEPIPVRVMNQAEGLALESSPGTVLLTLRADESTTVRGLVAADFDATIDLANVGAGARIVSVRVSTDKSGVSVVKVEPAEVSINLEPIREKVFSVEYDTSGLPAEGFRIAGVVLSRDTVTVRGGQSGLAKISSAQATVKFSGEERESFEQNITVVLYGAEGREVTGFSTNAEGLKASVIIEPEPAVVPPTPLTDAEITTPVVPVPPPEVPGPQ